MKKSDLEELKKLRKTDHRLENTNRFGFWLVENKQFLVVSILQEHIKALDEEIAALPPQEGREARETRGRKK